MSAIHRDRAGEIALGRGSEFENSPGLRMGIQERDSAVGPTHLADPANTETALQDEVKFLLNAKGGDITAEPQAVSNGAVLGTGEE